MLALVNRHPLVVDEAGLHTGGPLHFDIDWPDITEVIVSSVGGGRRFGGQLLVRVDPSSLDKYARTHGPWLRLMTELASGMGLASLQTPPLRINAEAAAEFIQEEGSSRRAEEATE